MSRGKDTDGVDLGARVVSLESRRTARNKAATRGARSDKERIAELEEDILRLVDVALEQEERLATQEVLMSRLLRQLAARLGMTGI